jgi:RHS repeat-associated protein
VSRSPDTSRQADKRLASTTPTAGRTRASALVAGALALVVWALPGESEARPTCQDVFGTSTCVFGPFAPLLDDKVAPASVGGTTRELFNVMAPRTDLPALRLGPLAKMSNLIGTGSEIDQIGSELVPRGLKSCLPKATLPGTAPAPAAGATSSQPQCGGPGSRGGHVDNLRWNYAHTGIDYSTSDTNHCTAQGCSSVTDDLPGQMQRLAIKRFDRPIFSWERSSFGPGVFSEFDVALDLEGPDSGFPAVVNLFDPETDAGQLTFYETSTGSGVFQETDTHLYKSFETFDASGAHAATVYTAVTAVLTMQTGEKWLFDIVTQEGTPEGRVTQKQDRNGNAVVISYVYPANIPSEQLGSGSIWEIASVTDPYGAKATFSYAAPYGAQWISSVALPNATTITYTYAPTFITGNSFLEVVTYPNGDQSSYQVDESDSGFTIFENYDVTTPEDSNVIIYLTSSAWVSPSGEVYGQTPNVLRMLSNINNETVYENWEDPTQPNVFYVYTAPNKVARINTAASSVGYPTEVAYAENVNGVPDDPTTLYYDAETYQADANSALTQRVESTGYTQNFTRDATTRAITAVKYPGSVQATAVYNGFREPTSLTDVLGTTHKLTYDAKGNMTTAVVASGTPATSTWTTTYNSRGQPATLKDGNGNVTTYGYDSKGNLTSIKDPPDVSGGAQATKTYVFDAVGRMTSMTDALAHKTTYSYDSRNRLTKITYADGTSDSYVFQSDHISQDGGTTTDYTDRNGVTTHYDYDANLRVYAVTRAVGKPEQQVLGMTYAPGSKLKATEQTVGTTVTYSYDEFNNPLSTEVPVGSGPDVELFTYRDPEGRVHETIDADGYITYYVFDTQNRVVRTVKELARTLGFYENEMPTLARDTATNPQWAIIDYVYDKAGHVTQVTDELGTVTKNTYDQQGRLTSKVAGTGATAQTTKYTYDASGNQTTVVRARTFTSEGNGTDSYRDQMTYTGRNLLATRTEAVGRTEAAVVQTLTYTPTKQKSTEKDGNGNTTTYLYDTNDRLKEVDDPLGHSKKQTFDGNGNRLTSVDGNGHSTSYAYDGLNRLTKTTNPAGEATTVTYDVNLTDGSGLDAPAAGLGFSGVAVGSASETVDAQGVATVSILDGAGRVVRQGLYNQPVTQLTSTFYESGAFTTGADTFITTTVQDGRGNTTIYAKDGNGAPRQVTDGEGQITTYSVNARGQNVSMRKATGVGMDWTYDQFGRQTSAKDTQGSTNGTTYDVENNVTVTTDPLTKTKTYTYDGRNQKKTETDELGKTTAYAYDGMHHVTSMTDAESRLTQYQYDARGLKTKVIDSDNVAATFAYDSGARLTSAVDQLAHTTTYAYDSADRMTGRTYSDALNDSFTYDKGSRLLTAKSGRYSNTITRAYDGNGELKTEKTTVGTQNLTTAYLYDGNANVTQVTYPNSSVLLNTYNKRDELTNAKLDGVSVATYTRDSAGRPTATAWGNGTTESRAFRLDDLVSSVKLAKGSTSLVNLSYTYDANKRKTAETNGLTSSESQTFTFDAANRPATWAQGSNTQSWALTATGDWTSTTQNGVVQSRTYDNAHALKTVGSATVTTDATGAITKDDTGATYTWDFDHQLKSAVVAGATTTYAWDALGRRLSKLVGSTTTVFANEGAREDARAVAEYDNGAFARLYVYGDGARDEVAVMKAGTAKYYFTHGAQYSVQAITSDAGAVAERYRYGSFGQLTVLNAAGSVIGATTIPNHVGFTGRYHDETGLVFYRTRLLSPRLGRFVSRDVDFYDGPNLYMSYFIPNGIDPSGQNFLGDGLRAIGDGANDLAGKAVEGGKELVNAVDNNVVQPVEQKVTGATHAVGKFFEGTGKEFWKGVEASSKDAWKYSDGFGTPIYIGTGKDAAWAYRHTLGRLPPAEQIAVLAGVGAGGSALLCVAGVAPACYVAAGLSTLAAGSDGVGRIQNSPPASPDPPDSSGDLTLVAAVGGSGSKNAAAVGDDSCP